MLTNSVSAEDIVPKILSTYKANQARFHAQWRGAILSGDAFIESIKADALGTGSVFYITLISNNSKIRCSTYKRDMAAAFDKNQRVNFSGEIHDVAFDILYLIDCNISNATAPAKSHELPSQKENAFEKRTLNSKCRLKIDGIQLMDKLCFFKSDGDTDFFDDLQLKMTCPNGNETTGAGDGCYGYEIRVIMEGIFGTIRRRDNIGEFCWNDGGARRAQHCYQNLRRTGACWKNNSVEFCAWKK